MSNNRCNEVNHEIRKLADLDVAPALAHRDTELISYHEFNDLETAFNRIYQFPEWRNYFLEYMYAAAIAKHQFCTEFSSGSRSCRFNVVTIRPNDFEIGYWPTVEANGDAKWIPGLMNKNLVHLIVAFGSLFKRTESIQPIVNRYTLPVLPIPLTGLAWLPSALVLPRNSTFSCNVRVHGIDRPYMIGVTFGTQLFIQQPVIETTIKLADSETVETVDPRIASLFNNFNIGE